MAVIDLFVQSGDLVPLWLHLVAIAGVCVCVPWFSAEVVDWLREL